MSKIAGMEAEQIYMQLNDSGVRMDVLIWARRHDPVFVAIHHATLDWPTETTKEAFIVGLLAAKISAEHRLLELVRNLKPADIVIIPSEGAQP